MFLVSLADMVQSKQLYQVPSFRRSLLNPRHPGRYHPSIDDMYVLVSSLSPTKDSQSASNDDKLISRIYFIGVNQLNRLQSLASDGCKRTKLEAFTAYLWKVVASYHYQKYESSDKMCRMGVVVDGRARMSVGEGDLNGKQMATYFGNVLSIPFGEKRSEELKEKPLSWVTDVVHEFLESAVTKEHFLELVDWVEAHRPKPILARIYRSGGKEKGTSIVVSSGQRFPTEKVNFGWGRVAFGSYHFPWGGEAGYVMPMPSPLGNGDWVVYMHLFKEQLNFIETHAMQVFKPVTSDYLKI